jgi:hypothetical protein
MLSLPTAHRLAPDAVAEGVDQLAVARRDGDAVAETADERQRDRGDDVGGAERHAIAPGELVGGRRLTHDPDLGPTLDSGGSDGGPGSDAGPGTDAGPGVDGGPGIDMFVPPPIDGGPGIDMFVPPPRDMGADLGRDMGTDLGTIDAGPGSPMTFSYTGSSATYVVPAIALPFIGGFGSGFTVHASHTEVVDPFRNRNDDGGEASCAP